MVGIDSGAGVDIGIVGGGVEEGEPRDEVGARRSRRSENGILPPLVVIEEKCIVQAESDTVDTPRLYTLRSWKLASRGVEELLK